MQPTSAPLRLEFIVRHDLTNGAYVTWQLRTHGGYVLAKSTEKWPMLADALLETGELFKRLAGDEFEVFGLTALEEAKIQAELSKNPPRSSKAATSPAPARSAPARKPQRSSRPGSQSKRPPEPGPGDPGA
jgi:hypothetical protein